MTLTPGKIYVCDTSPPSNDPDNYGSLGTEGTDWAVLDIPTNAYEVISTKKEPDWFPGQGGYTKALDYWDDRMTIKGYLCNTSGLAYTLADAGYWTELVATKGDDDGDLYLAICFGANQFWKFWDTDNSTMRQYCRGTFAGNDLTLKWVYHTNLMIEVTFSWLAIW